MFAQAKNIFTNILEFLSGINAIIRAMAAIVSSTYLLYFLIDKFFAQPKPVLLQASKHTNTFKEISAYAPTILACVVLCLSLIAIFYSRKKSKHKY